MQELQNVALIISKVRQAEDGPNVITDRTFITLGFKMLLQMGPLLHLGPISPIITLVPSTAVRAVEISKVLLPLLQYATNRKPRLCRNVERN